jgi:paraquat-inducible protein A
VCYIPANVLPITVVTSLGKEQADTIMSGVIYFLLHGSWPIALITFSEKPIGVKKTAPACTA